MEQRSNAADSVIMQRPLIIALCFVLLRSIPGEAVELDDIPRHSAFLPKWEHYTQSADIHFLLKHPNLTWEQRKNSILPLQKGPHWARLAVDNSGPVEQTIVLEDQWVPTNFIDVYVVRNNQIIEHFAGGDRQLHGKGGLPHRYPAFALPIKPGTTHLYLRYETDDVPGVRVALWYPEAFDQHRLEEMFVLGGSLGILLVMGLYNFIIYWVVRLRAYLYYSIYVVAFLIFAIFNQGLFSQWIYMSSWANDEAVLITGMVALMSALHFTEHFLRVEKNLPGSGKFRYYLTILGSFDIVISCIDLQSASILAIVTNIAGVLWVLYVALRLAFKRQMQAYVMLSAWGIFLAGNGWSMLYFVGLIPAGWGGRWTLIIGADFEVMMLSLGLGLYMAKLRREKMQAEVSEAKITASIEAATRFQENLLGMAHPHPCLKAASFFQPAERIGGDWYDIAAIADNRYCFLFVGDVTGHGLSSTLLSSAVSGCIHSTLYQFESDPHTDPGRILQEIASRANRFIVKSGAKEGWLMTMIMVCIDFKELKAYYLNAGHPHPFLNGKNSNFLVSRGSLLGVKEDPEFEVKKISLQIGDTLTLYTDGVLECPTRQGVYISQRSLMRILAENPDAPSAVQAIKACFDLNQGPLNDDITVLAVQIVQCWQKTGTPLAS